ncbi:hypothetical protein AB9K32_14065 [Allomuricauda sp. XS_ASV26]
MKPHRDKWDQTDVLYGLNWDVEILKKSVDDGFVGRGRKGQGAFYAACTFGRPRGSGGL